MEQFLWPAIVSLFTLLGVLLKTAFPKLLGRWADQQEHTQEIDAVSLEHEFQMAVTKIMAEVKERGDVIRILEKAQDDAIASRLLFAGVLREVKESREDRKRDREWTEAQFGRLRGTVSTMGTVYGKEINEIRKQLK